MIRGWRWTWNDLALIGHGGTFNIPVIVDVYAYAYVYVQMSMYLALVLTQYCTIIRMQPAPSNFQFTRSLPQRQRQS
jgi:hypothetical protein